MQAVSGIYKITNLATFNFYIGSSKNVNKRRNEHFARLAAGKHGNNKLQNSFNKHGRDIFLFELIEECPVSLLESVEQKYLDKKPYYNICPIANRISGIKRTKEWAEKISKANMGRKLSDEHRKKLSESHKGKPPGNKGIPCSLEKKAKISKSRKGKHPWNKGLKTGRNEKAVAANKGRKQSQEEKDKRALSLIGKSAKKVHQYSLDGVFIKEFISMTEADSVFNGVRNALTGRAKTAKGFIWKYKNNKI